MRHAILLGAALFASACGAAEAPPSILLVTLDTTRADAVGFGGGPAGLTPNLDRLAASACVFTNARTPVPLTLPAHASLFTGLDPPRHGVRLNGPHVLAQEATTLAEGLAAAGYQTAGFVACLALDRAFGIAQGFEVWSQPGWGAGGHPGVVLERTAVDVVEDARAFLADADPERPLFLWVHLFDPHAPYVPPERFLQRAGGDAYRGEVAAVDHALAPLLAELEPGGRLAGALVVVAGDHGEGLGENGEATHGLLCHDATLRVPLLVRWPDGRGAGERRDAIVGLADLFPTVLAAAGVAPPGGGDGVDLARPLDPARGVYFEALQGARLYGWSPLVGWVDRDGKYVHGAVPRFFHPAEDPREEHDRFAPDLDLSRYRAAIDASLNATPPAGGVVEDAALIALLAALGYGAAGTDELGALSIDSIRGRPGLDPRAMLPNHERYRRAEALAAAGNAEAAVPLLERVVEANPSHAPALTRLGELLLLQGRLREAVDVLEQRAALPPAQSRVHRALARAYRGLGDDEAAKRHMVRTLELAAGAHEARGEEREARDLRVLLERAPDGEALQGERDG